MRERVKTVFLLLLVAGSMFLTARLLFGQPYLETASPPAYEQLTFGELRPQQKQILPHMRLGEKDSYLVLHPWDGGHEAVWALFLPILRPLEVLDQSEAPESTEGNHLKLTFSLPIELTLWVNNPRLNGFFITEINWFVSDPQHLWFKEANGEWLRSQQLAVPPDWQQILAELFANGTKYRGATAQDLATLRLSDNEVLLPLVTPKLSVYAVEPETVDIEKLQRSIFVNPPLVRRIEERDGAVIYTDGQRGLRQFAHGELEFTAPENETGTRLFELTEALRQTAQYLQFMGGWPDFIYVDTIHVSETPTRTKRQWENFELYFLSAQHGAPVVSATPPLSLRFTDRGVFYYNRQLKILGNRMGIAKSLVPARTAVRAVIDTLGSTVTVARLVSIYYGYYVDGTKKEAIAQPSWFITLQDGRTAVVNGYTGQFLSWLA